MIHPIAKVCEEIAPMLIDKNRQYGNAVDRTARILAILYPNGIQTADFVNALTVTRVCDKLCRIANRAPDEDPWTDIAGYAILKIASRNGTAA